MRAATLLGAGVVGLAMVGACALSPERGSGEDGLKSVKTTATSAQEASDTAVDWHFSYDEARQEVTARRGLAVLVYPLRDMDSEGSKLIASFKGHDGATWALPDEPFMAGDGAEGVSQDQEPLVNVGPPPRVATPPVYGAGSHGGSTSHGAPPGWNSATWGKACQIAAALAVSFGCSAVTVDCAAGTVLTVGSVAVPCALLVALACGVGVGAGASLVNSCPK